MHNCTCLNLYLGTLDMAVINCSIPDCEFITDDADAILAVAEINIHGLVHQQGASLTGVK